MHTRSRPRGQISKSVCPVTSDLRDDWEWRSCAELLMRPLSSLWKCHFYIGGSYMVFPPNMYFQIFIRNLPVFKYWQMCMANMKKMYGPNKIPLQAICCPQIWNICIVHSPPLHSKYIHGDWYRAGALEKICGINKWAHACKYLKIFPPQAFLSGRTHLSSAILELVEIMHRGDIQYLK